MSSFSSDTGMIQSYLTGLSGRLNEITYVKRAGKQAAYMRALWFCLNGLYYLQNSKKGNRIKTRAKTKNKNNKGEKKQKKTPAAGFAYQQTFLRAFCWTWDLKKGRRLCLRGEVLVKRSLRKFSLLSLCQGCSLVDGREGTLSSFFVSFRFWRLCRVRLPKSHRLTVKGSSEKIIG